MITLNYKEITFFHPKLVEVIADMENEFGSFLVTSMWRTEGVHNTIPLRALDLRCHNDAVGRAVEEWVNRRWVYDPLRAGYDVCLYHDSGYGIHWHVQVHDNTKRAEVNT